MAAVASGKLNGGAAGGEDVDPEYRTRSVSPEPCKKFTMTFCGAGLERRMARLGVKDLAKEKKKKERQEPKQNSKSLAVRGATRAEVTGLLFRSNSPAFRIGGGGGRVTVVTFDTRKDCRRAFEKFKSARFTVWFVERGSVDRGDLDSCCAALENMEIEGRGNSTQSTPSTLS